MIPELIVPDLTGFPLRPYVSYRTDIEIEKRIANTDKNLAKNSKNPPIDKIWPPPAVDAKVLFDCFYADEIKKKYFETTTEKKKKSGFFASLVKKN
uniref:39S ribosomal protein L41, mitochondrial n=1 Tax=Meloidogyne incognita TaxID=6306 RepID=A0A914M3M0_MELIC